MFQLGDRVRMIKPDKGQRWCPPFGALGTICADISEEGFLHGKWLYRTNGGKDAFVHVLWDDPLPNGEMNSWYFRHRLEKCDQTPQDNFAELTGFEEV